MAGIKKSGIFFSDTAGNLVYFCVNRETWNRILLQPLNQLGILTLRFMPNIHDDHNTAQGFPLFQIA